MTRHSNEPLSAAKTPQLFAAVAVVLVALALVPTVWTSLDLSAAAPFMGPHKVLDASNWFWVEAINQYVPAIFRGLIFVALCGWAIATWGAPRFRHWRLPLAFIVLAGTLGPGVLVNTGFKDNWQRARPYQVENFGGAQKFTRAGVITDQCDNNCSFVSGHVACGFFVATCMLVQNRRRRVWVAGGLGLTVLIGFSRMADGAHWLSDVLWAGPVTFACSWVVWKVLLRVYRPEPAAQ